jgi:hypothetical protein
VSVSSASLVELTVPVHGAVAVPCAVTVLVTGPPVPVHVTVQLHVPVAPGASVDGLTEALQLVPVTFTPVSVTVPVFVTVPEKTTPLPPTQPSEQIWLTSIAARLHWQVSVSSASLTESIVPEHGADAVP